MVKKSFNVRFEALFGGYGAKTRFAQAMGLSREHVTRTLNGSEDVPEWWIAVIELLEVLPQERWPKRWRE